MQQLGRLVFGRLAWLGRQDRGISARTDHVFQRRYVICRDHRCAACQHTKAKPFGRTGLFVDRGNIAQGGGHRRARLHQNRESIHIIDRVGHGEVPRGFCNRQTIDCPRQCGWIHREQEHITLGHDTRHIQRACHVLIGAACIDKHTVRGQTLCDINADIAFGCDMDGVKVQRGVGEVTKDLHIVHTTCGVDLDLLDVLQLADHGFRAAIYRAGDDDIGAGVQRRACPCVDRVDVEGFVRGVTVDCIGVAVARTPINHIRATTDRPDDIVAAIARHQNIVACATGDHIIARACIDNQTLVRDEAREIDHFVAGGAVHVNRVGRQRCQGKVANRVDGFDTLHTVQGDLFDAADFHDRCFNTAHGAGDDDFRQRIQRLCATGSGPCSHRIHGEPVFGAIAIDDQHVSAAIVDKAMPCHHVVAAIGRIPCDGVRARFGKDQVVAGQAVDGVVASAGEHHVGAIAAQQHIIACSAHDHTIGGRVSAQINLHIGKAQHLDVPQLVHTIADGGVGLAVVGINPKVGRCGHRNMFNRDRPICIRTDRIVGAHIEIHGCVHIALLACIHDFTHDLQLARVDGAIQQFARDLDQAVDRAQLDRGVVGVAHRDTHVQRPVAIDDIVTAAALDGVAAATAQQNVTAGEGLQRIHAHQIAQHLAQAGNAVNAILGQLVAKQRGVIHQNLHTCGQVGTCAVVTKQFVVKLGARGRLGVDITVADHIEARQFQAACQVDIGSGHRIFMRNPVIAQIGIVHMHAFALDQDIVAAFAQQVVVVLAAVQHVMAQHARAAERIAHIADQQVKAVAAFDPVVAFAAEHHLGTGTTKDKVVAVHTKGFCRVVRAHQNGIVAFTAEHQLADTRTAGNHVVAIFAMQEGHIITIADDVIARTAAQGVHTRTADQQVVAITTPQRVIAQAANQLVILRCAAQNHVLAAIELQQVIIAAGAIHDGGIHGCGCPLHQGGAHRRQEGINPFRGGICNGLNGLIYLEDIFHRCEQIARNAGTTLANIGVARHDRGKRVVFQFRQHVHASRPRQVIEAVGVLQVLHLVLEDKAKA